MGTAMVDQSEITAVLKDLSWLDKCHCGQLELSDFFVPAGRTISEHALKVCRSCPARREEIIFAYARGISQGYAGGLSPSQRATLTLEQALDLAAAETAALAQSPAATA